jgi:hypothetical protein
VEPMRKGALPGAAPADVAAFWRRIAEVERATSAAASALEKAFERTRTLRAALERSHAAPDGLDTELHAIEQELYAIDESLNGNRSRSAVGEPNPPTVETRLAVAARGTRLSTYGPTPTHRRSLEIAEQELASLRERLNGVLETRLPAFEQELEKAGGPWTPGQPIPPVR